MPRPLNILIVEDVQDDADLALAELRRAGFDPKWKRVETEPDFLAEIKKSPDIILSDYSMPQFNGLRAAELLRKNNLDIPFILISGTVGEDIAVDAMKQGATDYLLKDRIARLGIAVERALEQKRLLYERKRAERSLNLFRTLVDQSNDGIEVIDPVSGCFLDVNETTCQRLGYTRGELCSMRVWDLDDVGVNSASWTEHIEEIRQASFKVLEGRHRRKDGSTFPIEVNVRYVRLDRDYLIAAVRDITERKRAEESLKLLESAIEQAKEAIVITDAELNRPGPKIIFVNPAFTRMTGYTAAEVIGKTPRILQGTRSDRTVLKQLRQNLEHGETFFGETINYRKDRTEYNLEWQIAPMRDDSGKTTHFVAIQRDITDQRKLESQFRQMQKMEAVSRLAGGVAHDFNNILAVIQMQAELLKISGGLSVEQLVFADEIGHTVQRAVALTRQLLVFSHKEIFQPRDLDLSASITDMAKMLMRILGDNIEMQLKLSSQPIFVHADAGMMDQILMNLVVNARDAMCHGGQLIIETSGVEFDEFAAAQSMQMRVGSFVCLSVSDSGCGIPPEILPKIFEPFFTTKDVGKGTGLGLATVFGIVQQHQGWITVYSEVNHGTTFRIYLPQLAPNENRKPARPVVAELNGGSETILLVEDEATLRTAVTKALSKLGYRILEAPTGVKALEVWKENRNEIRLLLTDLVMPGGMTGKDLAQKLLQDNPKLKVIYMSGYSADAVGKDFPLKEGANFLTKPFQVSKLAQTIRDNLDKSA